MADLIAFVEGAFFVNDSESKDVASLLENVSRNLLQNYEKIPLSALSKITQSLVLSSTSIKEAPSLTSLLERYIKENFNSPQFSRETKMNIGKVVDLAKIDKKVIIDQI